MRLSVPPGCQRSVILPKFMSEHTRFSTLDAMIEESQWTVETSEDFEAISDAEWDAYVAGVTDFDDREEMLQVAAIYFGILHRTVVSTGGKSQRLGGT